MNTKLWRCADCGRLRACPYSPLHFLALVNYVGCSCGDVCVNESDHRTAALKAAIADLMGNDVQGPVFRFNLISESSGALIKRGDPGQRADDCHIAFGIGI